MTNHSRKTDLFFLLGLVIRFFKIVHKTVANQVVDELARYRVLNMNHLGSALFSAQRSSRCHIKNPTDKAASHQEKLVLKDAHANKTNGKNQQHQNQYDRFLLVHSLLLPLHQYELRIALGDDGCESDIEHQQKSFQQNYQQHRYPYDSNYNTHQIASCV